MKPEYGQWAAMLSRCRNPNFAKYRDYGGRGIKVCSRWELGEHGRSGFECFFEDMGQRPTAKHSIDRKDNDGHYEPSNCRWSTNKRQANNRRSNRKLAYLGETLSMMDMAEKYGISYYVLRNRISRGWPVDKAITAPFGTSYRPRRVAVGASLPQTVLTVDEVTQIRNLYSDGAANMYQLAIQFQISPANVCMIVNRKTWKHVI